MLTDEQRAALHRAQLRGLVRDLTGRDSDPETVGRTTAVLLDGTGFVLSDVAGAATLAGAIAWSLARDAERTTLFVDRSGDPADLDPGSGAAGEVARMASQFRHPVEVRVPRGSSSVAVAPAVFRERTAAVTDPELEAQLRAAGLEIVVEDGVVRGEVLGLEVARLVCWPTETGGDGLLHLEAGVGRFDRDAVAAMHQGELPTTTLARSVATVRAERVPGSGGHPLSRLSRERWLRCSLLDDPARIGAVTLSAVETTVRRDSVRDVSPAAAIGTAEDGTALVVVCSTGADLSFVPIAADTRAWFDPTAHLLLAVPSRDRLPILERLAAGLVSPATVVVVPEPWTEGASGPSTPEEPG